MLLLFIPFFFFFGEREDTITYNIDEIKMDYLMGLEYQIHEDFVGRDEMDCFDSIPKLKYTLTCKRNIFNSKDDHVKIFIGYFEPMTKEDSTSLARILPPNKSIPVNTQHIYQIIGDIRVFYSYTQEEANKKWQEHVHYFPQEEARQICNADTLISYTLTLDENESYKGRYKHIAVYYMQKHDRGNVGLYCFYDDDAAKNPEKYMNNILNMFHYREPFTRKPLPEMSPVIIELGTGNQKKAPLREDDVLRELIEKRR
jgi:hypothetical protein